MKSILTFLLIWLFATEHSSTPSPTSFPNSGIVGRTDNALARKDFERALLLLHNFEYPDAAELFRAAQQKDPSFALAYWGEAMTYNHPVWLSQDAASAREVLKKYNQISGSQKEALPSLDKDLLASLDLLYGEGNKRERDKAYADFMATLYKKYKGHVDVAAFYSLSLLGAAGGWDEKLCHRAAEIAASILKENPTHPGALHYFIHAEDHPEFAKNAWNAANDYAKVASYSGHALHMPSHIYLALGLWDDVVKSNEISWQAGIDRKDAKKLSNDALNYHGHWWLEYGYLQQGRFSKAAEILTNQLTYTRALPSSTARTHFVIMKGHYLAETNDWANKLASEEVKVQDLRIEIRTLDRFLKALSAYRNQDKVALEKYTKEIEDDIAQSKQMAVINEGISQCKTKASSQAVPSQTGINQAIILQEELKALLSFLNNDISGAKAHFNEAIKVEEQNGHFFGPPEILKPTHEFFGEFLLAIGQPREARPLFEKALQKTPGRSQSLAGLMETCRLTGDINGQKSTDQRLKKNIQHGEVAKIPGFFTRPQ